MRATARELVASFGRSIREGYMASRTDVVELRAGRPARTLRAVLEEAGPFESAAVGVDARR